MGIDIGKNAAFQFISRNLSTRRGIKQIIQEKRLTEKRAARTRLSRLAPAIAAFVLLLISGTLWWQIYRADDKLHLLQNALRVSKQKANRVSQLNEIEEALQKQQESLLWATEDYPMVSYRLYEIASAIPDSLWLKEVRIPEWQPSRKKREQLQPISKLYVVGYANEQRQIEEFLGNLRKCDCFSDVKQESTSEARLGVEKVLEFKIGLTTNPIRGNSAPISYASN